MAVLHECAYLRLDYCHGRVGRAGYGKRMLSTFRGHFAVAIVIFSTSCKCRGFEAWPLIELKLVACRHVASCPSFAMLPNFIRNGHKTSDNLTYLLLL